MKGGMTEAQAAKMFGFKDGDVVVMKDGPHTPGEAAYVRFTAVEKAHKQTLAQLDQAVKHLAVELVRARTTVRFLLATTRNVAGLVLTTSDVPELKSAMMVAEATAREAVTQLKALPLIFDQVTHDSPAIQQSTVDGMKGLLKIHHESKFDTPQWDKAVDKLPMGMTKPAPGDELSTWHIGQVVAELMGGWGASAAQAAMKKEAGNALQAAWDKSVHAGHVYDTPVLYDEPDSGQDEALEGYDQLTSAPLPKWVPKFVDGELVVDDATGFAQGALEEAGSQLTKYGFPHGSGSQPSVNKVMELWAKKLAGVGYEAEIKVTHTDGEPPEGSIYIKFDPVVKSIALSVCGWKSLPDGSSNEPLFLVAPCASEAVAEQVAEEFKTVCQAYVNGGVGKDFVEEWFFAALKKAHHNVGLAVLGED